MAISKEQLDEYIAAYNAGTPMISDEQYDQLLEEYVAEHGESSRPYTRQKQSSSINDLVGTLDKCYLSPLHPNQIYYKDYITKHGYDFRMCLQPKFDGCSVAVDFTTGKFYTRGNYDDGESLDVTPLFKDHLDIVKQHALGYDTGYTLAMKFEAIMSESNFIKVKELMNKDYKRARDAVSAILTPPYNYAEYAKYIDLIPLRGYDKRGCQYIPEYTAVECLVRCYADDFDTIESFAKRILENGASVKIDGNTYAIDGVVVSNMLNPFEEIPIVVNPDQEFAIKILTNVKTTKLVSIDYQFGKQGRITPVAILEPVNFDNVTVDHVTLSTLQRVVDMKLRHNDTVRIAYNIVPYFLSSYHDGDYPIPVPDKCPVCGAPLDYLTYKLVRCTNPNCKGLKIGSIIRHAEKMKMVGFGEGVITKLYDKGYVTCIADLYDLQKWDDCIPQEPGFGYASYENMMKSVKHALSDMTIPRFLGALPFNDIDEKTWKQILTVISDYDLINIMKDGSFPEWLMTVGPIPNVGKLKIQKIIDGYLRYKEELQQLLEQLEDELKSHHVDYAYGKAQKVCLTGTRDADLIQDLESSGYEVGGWSNDCICVIVPNHDFESEKTRKAKAKGIPIYDLSEARWHLVQPF